MPNHYTNLITIKPDCDDDDEPIDVVAMLLDGCWKDQPLNRAVPMPADPPEGWYDWQWQNRGTKWDAYDVAEPLGLPGDMGVVLLVFCTAWNAPNQRTRDAMAAELLDKFGALKVWWDGYNPANNKRETIGTWEKETK